jgi:DNA primase
MQREKKPFVDFRAIRSHITMEQLLEHYGVLSTFKRNGRRLSGPCPIHNGKNPTQFRVDTERNIWNCFSECKQGGNVLDFIAKKEGVAIHDAAIKACQWFGIPLEENKSNSSSDYESARSRVGSPKAASKPKLKAVSAPDASRPEENTPNQPLKFRLEHLHEEAPYLTQTRSLTLQTINEFGLGFFKGEKGLMVGRVVIPIHNPKAELVAYAGRWPGEPAEGTPKYMLPKNFRKALELFNIHRALKEPPEQPWVIVEGFFDAIKLHQHGFRKVVALMGSSMSPAQETLMRQHLKPDSHTILMLDEDAAGIAGSENIAARIAKFCFVKVHVFGKPEGQPEYLSTAELKQILGDAR